MSDTGMIDGRSVLNPWPTKLEGPCLLHDLVGRGNEVAVDYYSTTRPTGSLSYDEFHAASDLLAQHISERILLPERQELDSQAQLIIPLLISQSAELYIAQLAVLKAGGAFCPLNLDTPQERIKFILNDVGARIVLCGPGLGGRLPVDPDLDVLVVDASTQIAPGSAIREDVPAARATEESLAYVMYTSGSTGTPKGVGISHGAVTQALLAHDRHIPKFKRFLQFAAPTFDVSVFEIFFPFMRGSTLVCCDRADMLSDLPGVLSRLNVDACELTPSVAGSLLKSRSRAPGLRLLLTIGEMLTDPVIREFGGDAAEDSILWGMYGPTEATIHCTLQPAFLRTHRRQNIGFPLVNVSAFIVDTDPSKPFEPLAIGQVGELVIGGTQLAVGYIHREEQTSAVFIDSPYGRVYRTGDKAVMNADCTIDCIGRINETQVKLNGQRMELGEVEQVALETPGCHSAVAAIAANTLVLFAAVDDVTGAKEQVLGRCKSWLPAFMVPSDVQIMPEFPRLPSGKVDRKTLIALYEAGRTAAQDDREMFVDEVEEEMCRIAAALTGRHTRPSERLASLGIDSLVAIQYASELRREGFDISPIAILEHSTIHDLHIASNRRSQIPKSPTDHDRAGKHGERKPEPSPELPLGSLEPEDLKRVASAASCTVLQQSMITETFQDPRLYINELDLEFPPSVAPEVIRTWLLQICQENEILRSGFVQAENGLYHITWHSLPEEQIKIVYQLGRTKIDDTERFLRHPLEVQILEPGQGNRNNTIARIIIHHAIYDGWTADLLIEHLNCLYHGESPPPAAQFRNVVRASDRLKTENLARSKEFWAAELQTSVPTAVPDFRTSPVAQPQICTSRRHISLLPQTVKDFCDASSISPQVVFQASLAWLWSGLTGLDDVIIGSVTSGRTIPVDGIDKVMGPFMSTIPLRVQFDRFQTIAEFLQVIQDSNRRALRHGDLSLSEIKSAAGMPARSRIFDVIFVYQESLPSRKAVHQSIREISHKDAVEAKLLVEVQPAQDHYKCQMTWHSEYFTEDLVNKFAEQIESLVTHSIAGSGGAVSSLRASFGDDALSKYNAQPKSLDVLPDLATLVEETTAKYPDHVALQFAESISGNEMRAKSLKYAELNAQANQIAHCLQGRGVKSGDIVAIVMEKSPLLYSSILGILKTGSAYLPILPSTPALRKQRILDQAKPRLCLTSTDLESQLAEELVENILTVGETLYAQYSTSNVARARSDSAALAYVIYTSGTTGVPKGVAVTNRNMLSNIKAISAIYPHSPSSKMLQACSQAFDVSVFEIFFAWANGMCLCSATNDTLFENLGRAVSLFQVTHLSMTVTVASLLHPVEVPSVEFLVTSGEPMTDEVLAKWAKQLWQGYGPSETTNICTVRKVEAEDSSHFLGWAFDNTSTFVCYPGTSELVPIGCVGEFLFGGDQVAAGYLQMPELTAERFFDHPQYGRLYRSGDRGRMLPDGSLIILGRIDTQIKLRGLRIELQEIQRVVLRTGLARACEVVVFTQKSSNTQQLALFYASPAEDTISFEILPQDEARRNTSLTIQSELRAALPDYMVPTLIVPISALPRTSSGKIDRTHLRYQIESIADADFQWYECTSEQEQDSTDAEWTQTERLVAQAAAETAKMKVSRITKWSSFATLGIDSILAMTLARRLRKLFSRSIPLSLVLKQSSVGRLAAVIDKASAQNEVAQSTRPELLPAELVTTIFGRIRNDWGDIRAILPCTPLQEGMLFANAGATSSDSYCNVMLFRLNRPSAEVVSYWEKMFARHEILRTCFASTEDMSYPVVQVVLKSSRIQCRMLEAESQAGLHQRVAEVKRELPVSVDSGRPPVLLSIIKVAGQGEYICFVCHHALYDGISVRVLLSEIETLALNGSLPGPVSFEKFLGQALAPVSGTEEFWKDHFRDFCPRLFQFEAGPSEDTDQATHLEDFCSHSLRAVELRLKEYGVSLLSLCQASMAMTLSLLKGSADLCFGNVVSGRSLPLDDIDRLVAPCFNTIPIRVDLSSSKFRLDLAKKLQSLNTESLPFHFTSLRRIQALATRSARLFDTLLILQPGRAQYDDRVWSLEEDSGDMDVPIVCEVTPDRDNNVIRLGLYRQRNTVSQKTLALFKDVFQFALTHCLDHPLSQVIAASNLPEEWRGRLSENAIFSPNVLAADADGETGADDTEAWSSSEKVVRSVVAKLTSLPDQRIERERALFHYGIDSIGIIQLVGMLKKASLLVSVADAMENPTCAKIAAHARRLDDDDGPRTVDFDFEAFQDEVKEDIMKTIRSETNLEDMLPCTAIQQGMISQSSASEGHLYFNYISWEFDKPVDSNILAEAWQRLRKSHQILRAGFVPVNSATSSYAMVIWRHEHLNCEENQQITLKSGGMKLEEWRTEVAERTSRDLSRPPWHLVVEDRAPQPPAMHLCIHHALYDAHSLHLMMRSLVASLRGHDQEPEQSIRTSLRGILAETGDNSEFWTKKAEEIVVNRFPTMTPLVEPRGISKAHRACQLDLSELKYRAANKGVSVQAALQVAWTRLLSAYEGESTVTFGVVLSGRSSEQDLQARFPMIATLPVIGHATGSVSEQLRRMMQYNAGLQRHIRTPLAQIQKWLGRPSESLFDTLLVYQVTEQDSDKMPWKVVQEEASVEYTISLEVEETGHQLRFSLAFDTGVLPQEQAEILLAQLDAILIDTLDAVDGGFSSDTHFLGTSPSLEVDTLSILPAAQPVMKCAVELLNDMVAASARRNSDAVALEFVEELENPARTRRWTYAELDSAGNKVANFLASNGVPQGHIVAVCFNKVPEAYFSIYGILKAGCSFLALDPAAPASRQEFILRDSGAACLIVEDTLRSQLEFEAPVPVYTASADAVLHSSEDAPSLERPISPSDPCYCLYTSGTTGTPKGCLISHENTVQAMLAFEHLFKGHWTDQSRWLQFASFHFDVSVLEQYWSWYVGITVVSAPRDLILSNLIETISKLEITHIDLTPSLARLVHPDDVPSLCQGVFITGGEQLRQDVLEAWGPQQVIYNAYGPTEATIGVTMFQRVPKNGRPSNIGRQFPNVGAYVLEPGTDVPVLRGAVGELCVSGKLVGIGYLNRPELTMERFAFLGRFNERVYRTGDLVRVLHDGTFDFLGRADDQVKLRGQRLEIGEINHAIKSGLPYSADVATLVTKPQGQQDRDVLVSFITAGPDKSSDDTLHVYMNAHASEMSMIAQNACKARLPGYMVPTYVLCVPWIPLSANNKANMNSLKDLFQSLSQEKLRQIAQGTKSAQRQLSPTEKTIAEAVCKLTGVSLSDVVHSSTILELGVDSISVTRLSRALQTAGFSQATPSTLLKNGSIERIAKIGLDVNQAGQSTARLQVQQLLQACSQRNLATACKTLGVGKDDVEYIAPCTALQEGMIARARSSDIAKPYFNQFELKLNPGLTAEQLRQAWSQLQERSSVLRTAFLQAAEGFVQVALKRQGLKWSEIVVEGDSVTDLLTRRHSDWVESNEANIVNPFEVDHITFDGQGMLVIRLFHAVYDAHSLKLMLENVSRICKAEAVEQGANFYDAFQAGPLLPHQSSRSFWTDLFANWQLRPFPVLSDPHTTDAGAVTVTRHISADGFENKRKALGIAHQTMVQTAWFAVLQAYHHAQPCFGVVYSGRSLDLDGAENVIGPLFNTLPFTTPLSGATTWEELARQVQNFNATVLDFVHTPLRSIQKWCANGRPLFDSLFTFDREDVISTGSNGLWKITASSAAPDYSLALEAVLTCDGDINVTIVARKEVADESICQRLLRELENNLRAIINSENSPVVSISGIKSNDIDIEATSHGSRTSTDPSPRSASPSSSSASSWPDQSLQLRHEIALIAGISDEEVLPAMTIFDIGLDSIDAIRLASRAASLGYRVSPGSLLRGETIGSLLHASDDTCAASDGSISNTAAFEAIITTLECNLQESGHDFDSIEAVLPTTPLQDSMIAEMIQSGFRRYFNHEVFEILPGVDLPRLIAAWTEIYAISPILRTTFVEVESPEISSAYCQVVRQCRLHFNEEVVLEDLTDLDVLMERIRSEAARVVEAPELFQLKICRLDGQTYLLVSISHALYDGKSLDMIYHDVQKAYNGQVRGRPEYKPYLARIMSTTNAEATDFWSNLLHDVQPTHLQPLKGASESSSTICRAESMSHCGTSSIKDACRKLGVTPQVLAQASWAVVLSTMTHHLESTFGLVLSGRDTDLAQELNFPTMNTVAMRVVLHGTVKTFLRHLQTTMSHIMEFQHTPLRQIQKLARTQGDRPLFNTLFVFQTSSQPRGYDQSLMRPVQGSSAVEFPVCIEFEMTEPQPTWLVACDSRYGTQQMSTKLLDDLDKVLGYLCRNSDVELIQTGSDIGKISICDLEPFRVHGEQQQTAILKGKEKSAAACESSIALDKDVLDVIKEISGVSTTTEINPEDSVTSFIDSISAIKVSALLRKRGIYLSVRELLGAGTIARISELASKKDEFTEGLETQLDSAAVNAEFGRLLQGVDYPSLMSRVSLHDNEVEETLPALPMQVYMLSMWQNTQGALFWPTFRYRLKGVLDRSRLTSAWQALAFETPILRTAFLATETRKLPFLQVVKRPSQLHVVEGSSPDGRWQCHISSSPYVCIQITESAMNHEFVVCLRIHHALYDAFSLPMMMKRFEELCGQDVRPELSSKDEAWTVFTKYHVSKASVDKRKEFWTAYLQGARGLPSLLPRIDPNGGQSDDDRSKEVSEFRKAVMPVSGSLASYMSSRGVSMQHMFFAAYAKVLVSMHSNKGRPADQDVVFGVYLSNRANFVMLDESRAPTLALVPLRVRDPASRSLGNLASEIQQGLQDISSPDNASVGLWEIHDWTGLTIDTFVNFLPTVDDNARGPTADVSETKISLENVAPSEINEIPKAQSMSGLASPEMLEIAGNRVRDSYPNALDIEAAVREDSLDIGVFARPDKMAREEAIQCIDGIVRILREVEGTVEDVDEA